MSETSEEERLVQPGTTMFVRNIGHMASRKREVEIHFTETQSKGFLAGLDEDFIQLCLTENQALAMIARKDIVMISETGRTLSDYERTQTMNADAIRRIREKIDHFARKTSYSFRKQ